MLTDKKILIVGLGLIGGSYAMGLKKAGLFVGALDVDKTAIDYALENEIIDEGRTDADGDFIAKYDVVIFCLYPSAFEKWIAENGKKLKNGAVITDVTGVKSALIPRINALLDGRCEYIAAHPMAGREISGVQNASPEMFHGANYIITPTSENTEGAIALAREIGASLDFKEISVLTPEKHDEMIGYLSQLTHGIAVALMLCKDVSGMERYTGDSFRDLTRIAKINDAMWSELFLANKDELLSQMELFEKSFAELKDAVSGGDTEKIREMMRLSTERRRLFDK